MRRRVAAGLAASVLVLFLFHTGNQDSVKNESGVTTTTSREVCTVVADGSIQRWYDAEGTVGRRVDCP